MRKRRLKGLTWPINDPALLRELVQQAVKTRFGDQRRAAEATGLSQSWISRMLNPETSPTEIQKSVVPALRQLLGDEDWPLLIPIFVPKASDVLFTAHREWLRLSKEHSAFGTGQWCIRDENGPRIEPINTDEQGRTQRDYERDALLQHLAISEAPLKARLDALLSMNDMPEERQLITLSRILDLLIESAESGFAEPSWRDLHPEDLREIVDLGITREELLLKGRHIGNRIIRSVTASPKVTRKKKR